MNRHRSLCVFGAGSWGNALALLAAQHEAPTQLWGHRPAHITTLAQDQENKRYLPGVALPDQLALTSDLTQAATAEDWLLAVPCHALASLLPKLQPFITANTRIAWACKGLSDDGTFVSTWLSQFVETSSQAMVSGPNFAHDIALGKPAATTVAGADTAFVDDLMHRLASNTFRVYGSNDLVGVELAAAMKNVIAIGAGLSDGLGLGANALASFMTRGLHEMRRLGLSLGAQSSTFLGLAGMGDLVLTCSNDQSRNRQFGLKLAKGNVLNDASVVVEGKRTAPLLLQLAQQHQITLPICEAVHQILLGQLAPKQALHELMTRPLKEETVI